MEVAFSSYETSCPSQSLRRVEAVNRMLERLWRTGLARPPQLELTPLLHAAFGDAQAEELGEARDWLEPLQHLLDSLREEAQLNPLGRTIAHALIVKALRDRRRARRLWLRHPEILDRPVTAPIVVLGPMRSGTTRLHRLLACDPRFAPSRLFETMSPLPPGARLDVRPATTTLALFALRLLNPALIAAHPTRPNEPEEEFGLFNLSFGSAQFEAQWRVPTFSRHWEEVDTSRLYAEFRQLIQTIGWARGEDPAKPVLMKAPQFAQDLDSFLNTFPDARIICLTRPSDQVIASSASLVWQQMRIQSDHADPHWIGQEWTRKYRLRAERSAAALARRPATARIEIAFEAVNRDWRAEMRRVYDFLGLTLSQSVEARMAAYLGSCRAHLDHRYKAADFGISSEGKAGALPPTPARQGV